MMDKKTYPLHKVVQYRNIRKIQILLPETKYINEKDEKGQTVLHIASEQEIHNDEIMELILSHEKIDPTLTNQDNFNALHLLAFKGNLTGVKKMFEKFPDMAVDDITDKGNTPLILATKMNHLEIIRYLHGKGADINHKNKKKFIALSYAANNGYEETTKALLELGAAVNHRDDYGCTPLIKAASWGFTEVCEILLDHEACVDVSNERGQTALIQAIRRKNIETVKILLEHGADTNKIVSYNNRLYTPLISACLSRKVQLVQLLIKHGADVNYPKPHSIALFTCVKQGFSDGVRALLDAGVNIRAAAPTGGTALKSARRYKHHDIVELLEGHQ